MANAIARSSNETQILKKHVSAVHMRAELSFLQRKLANALLYNAYDGLLTDSDHSVNAAVLCEMIGFDSKNISYLKAALKGLIETVVEFDVLEENGKNSWEAMSLLSFARIRGGVCEYRYDRGLSEKLYHPDVYAKINLSVMREMKSAHALVLYENCYRYVDVQRTPWWDIEMFRKLMAVDNKPSYKPFKALNRNVIQPAMKEVNKLSNIQVEMETRTKGRTVTGIQFTVKPNPQLSLLSMEEQDEITQSEAYIALRKEGISKKLARAWTVEHPEDYILEKIDLVHDQDLNGKIKSSRSGFLKAAVEQDFHNEKKAKHQRDMDARERLAGKGRLERRISSLTQARKELEQLHRKECIKLIVERYNGSEEAFQNELDTNFVSELSGKDILIRTFRKDGWSAILLFSQTFDFWKRNGLALPSSDEFAAEKERQSVASLSEEIKQLEQDLKAM